MHSGTNLLRSLMIAALFAGCVASEPETAVEEEDALAACVRVDPVRDQRSGVPAPPIARAGDVATACDELNEHLAAIAHLDALMELEEGGAR
jgi:hypothetical protein